MTLPLNVQDLPHLDGIKNPILQQCLLQKLFNIRNLKCLGKVEENGVNISHVHSMRPYEHILETHAKKWFLVTTCHFTLLGTQYKVNLVISTYKTCLPFHQVVLIRTYLKSLFSTNLSSRNNIIIMNKSQSYHNKQENY